jgi:hypothetical protein
MNWQHPLRLGSDEATDNAAYGDFNKEDSIQINVLIREVFQNLVDAEKTPDAKCKKVKIKILRPEDGLDVSFIEELLSSHEARLNASPQSENKSIDFKNVLIIQEENFKGLTGPIHNDQDSITAEEKKTNHFRHFFFTKGLTFKTGSANGRANRGKITYYNASEYKTVFAISKRFDSEPGTVLFGTTEFPSAYVLDGQRFKFKSFYGDVSDPDSPRGTTEPSEIAKFTKAFGLSERKSFGTTWIIPNVDEALFTAEEFLPHLCDEFFSVFIKDGFELDYRGTLVNRDSFKSIVDKYDGKLTVDDVNFFDECITTPDVQICHQVPDGWISIPYGEKKDLGMGDDVVLSQRQKLNAGEIISFKFPIEISNRNNEVFTRNLKVFLKEAANSSSLSIRFMRGDLSIKKEPKASPIPRGLDVLVLADDEMIGEVLALAEDAAHEEFNTKENPKLETELETLGPGYLASDGRQNLFGAIRYAAFQAAINLIDAEAVDHEFFGSIFSVPSNDIGAFDDDDVDEEEIDEEEVDDEEVDDEEVDGEEIDEIIRNVQLLSVNDAPGGLSIKDIGVEVASYPISFKAELAFMISAGNPFAAYSKEYDFDLSDNEVFSIVGNKAEVISANANQLEARILEEGGSILLQGFGASRVDIRLNIDDQEAAND